jgi:plastocyanin
MTLTTHTPVRRVLGAALVPLALAFSAVASDSSTLAHADSGTTITGTVTATPAKYLPETVVYLKNVPGTFGGGRAIVDQKGMKFIPHVSAITAGDTVEFQNHDTMDHNVFSPDGKGFNIGTFKPGESRTNTFTEANVSYSVLCSIHPEMLAYIFVGQNSYHAVVDSNGSFTIKNVPPGTYSVAVWNSKLKASDQSVTVAAGASVTASFALTR